MEGFTKHGLKRESQERHFSQVSCTSEDIATFFQHTSLSLHKTFNTKEKFYEYRKHKNTYGQDSQLTTNQESHTDKKILRL